MVISPGPYSCPCGQAGSHNHGRRFTPPITGRLTTVAGEFDIHEHPFSSPTWVAYPAGADRKERRRLDIKRRKAQRKRRPQ